MQVYKPLYDYTTIISR